MAAQIPYLKQGDTARDITDQLLLDGDAINLTGATVAFVAKGKANGGTIGGAASIVDALLGTVKYTPVDADVDVADTFDAEWQITFLGGSKLTVPSSGYAKLIIIAKLT
jgi:hypothetical protein